MGLCSVECLFVLALVACARASVNDNAIEGGDRIVLVAPVLAPPRDYSPRSSDRARQFPILVLLAQQNAPKNSEPQAKSLPIDPQPIYVQKLEDQEKSHSNRQKRHLHKILGLGHSLSFGGGGSFGYGGGGYSGGGYDGGYGGHGYQEPKTVIVKVVKEHGHHHGGGSYGGGNYGGYNPGHGGGYNPGYGTGYGGGGGGGGGGGYGPGYGNSPNYGGHVQPSHGGCGGGCGGNYGNGGSSATATATATATAHAGGYGYKKRK